MFKKRFSSQGYSSPPMFNQIRLLTPNPHEGKGGRSYVNRPLSSKYGRRDARKCLLGTDNCYNCLKSCHMKNDFPKMKTQEGRMLKLKQGPKTRMLLGRIAFMLSNPEVTKRAPRTWSHVC